MNVIQFPKYGFRKRIGIILYDTTEIKIKDVTVNHIWKPDAWGSGGLESRLPCSLGGVNPLCTYETPSKELITLLNVRSTLYWTDICVSWQRYH